MGQVWELLADGGDTRCVIGVNGNNDPGVYLKREFEALGVDRGDQVVVTVDEDDSSITINCGPHRD